MDVDGAAAGGAEEATPQGAAAAEASPAPAADGPAAAAPAAAAPVASQAPESGGKKRKYAKLPDEVSQALTAAFAANEAPDMAERKRLAMPRSMMPRSPSAQREPRRSNTLDLLSCMLARVRPGGALAMQIPDTRAQPSQDRRLRNLRRCEGCCEALHTKLLSRF